MWRALLCLGLFYCLQTATAQQLATNLGDANRASYTAYVLYRAVKGEGARVDHFYTTNLAEVQSAVKNLGYKREGNAGYIFRTAVPGSTPLYRLLHGIDHMYTTSATERNDAIKRLGFKDEGVAGYVFSTKKSTSPPVAPLYRMYNAKTQDHFYTMSAAEKDNAAKQYGYKYEGIAAWIYPL